MIKTGDIVKIKGSNISGEVIEIFSERDRMKYGTFSKILLYKVKHEDGKVLDYVCNEVSKIENDMVPKKGIVVDCGSVNGKNPGTFEYRLVDIETRKVIYNKIIPGTSSNNIAEWLALVDGIKFVYDDPSVVVYSDSMTALAWVRNKSIKTTVVLEDMEQIAMIESAIKFLKEQRYRQPEFWSNKLFGENFADYNRK